MIKINLVAVGDIKETYLTEAIKEYSKRISRFANLKIFEIKENNPKSDGEKDIQLALNKDAESIKKYLKGHLICLDVAGKMLSSADFSKKIEEISLKSGEITFIIGASNGIADEIKAMSHELISFSKMTFPHQLMRVIFLEQLYRAFTISNHIAYHK